MKRKIIVINLIMLVTVFMLAIKVNAADTTFKLQIKESKNEINYGDEVLFTISIADLQKGEAVGTNAITAKIDYPSNILQYEDYTTNNKWTMTSFNENNMTFAMTNSQYIAENQDIVTFKFKAKTDINDTNATVSLKNISAGFRMSEEDVTKTSTIKAEDVSKTIHLLQKQNENTTPDQNTVADENTVIDQNTVANENTVADENTIADENSTTNENDNSSFIGNVSNNTQNNTTITKTDTNSDTSAATKILPSTGIKNIILIIAFILSIVVVINVIAYYKYKKLMH